MELIAVILGITLDIVVAEIWSIGHPSSLVIWLYATGGKRYEVILLCSAVQPFSNTLKLMGNVFVSVELVLLSICPCKRSWLLIREMKLKTELQSSSESVYFILSLWWFSFSSLKKKCSRWFNFPLKPAEISGHLFFVKTLFSLKRKEYLGTVIWDLGQSKKPFAFRKFSSSHF